MVYNNRKREFIFIIFMKGKINKIANLSIFIALMVTQLPVLYGFGVSQINGDQSFSFELNPRENRQETIQIYNTANTNLNLIMYGADASTTPTGILDIKDENELQTNVGKWISFDTSTINLGPKEEKDVIFHVNIPANTPPGTYVGAIAVSSINKSKIQQNTTGLISIIRSLTPVYINIPGVEKNSFEFNNFSFTDDQKNPQLTMTVKNTGNTLLAVDGQINIQDINTKQTVQTIKINGINIFQNEGTTISKPLDKTIIKEFINKYKASVTLTFSKINIKTNKNDALQSLTKEITFEIDRFENLYITIGIIISLLLVIIIIILSRRWYKARMEARAIKYTVGENETIEVIAQKQGVHWEKIAHMNKLKAPYTLQKDVVILIPQAKKK